MNNLFDFEETAAAGTADKTPANRSALSFMDTLTPTEEKPLTELIPGYQSGERFVLREGYVLDLETLCREDYRCPDCGGQMMNRWYRHETPDHLSDGFLFIHHCAASLADGATCCYYTVR